MPDRTAVLLSNTMPSNKYKTAINTSIFTSNINNNNNPQLKAVSPTIPNTGIRAASSESFQSTTTMLSLKDQYNYCKVETPMPVCPDKSLPACGPVATFTSNITTTTVKSPTPLKTKTPHRDNGDDAKDKDNSHCNSKLNTTAMPVNSYPSSQQLGTVGMPRSNSLSKASGRSRRRQPLHIALPSSYHTIASFSRNYGAVSPANSNTNGNAAVHQTDGDDSSGSGPIAALVSRQLSKPLNRLATFPESSDNSNNNNGGSNNNNNNNNNSASQGCHPAATNNHQHLAIGISNGYKNSSSQYRHRRSGYYYHQGRGDDNGGGDGLEGRRRQGRCCGYGDAMLATPSYQEDEDNQEICSAGSENDDGEVDDELASYSSEWDSLMATSRAQTLSPYSYGAVQLPSQPTTEEGSHIHLRQPKEGLVGRIRLWFDENIVNYRWQIYKEVKKLWLLNFSEILLFVAMVIEWVAIFKWIGDLELKQSIFAYVVQVAVFMPIQRGVNGSLETICSQTNNIGPRRRSSSYSKLSTRGFQDAIVIATFVWCCYAIAVGVAFPLVSSSIGEFYSLNGKFVITCIGHRLAGCLFAWWFDCFQQESLSRGKVSLLVVSRSLGLVAGIVTLVLANSTNALRYRFDSIAIILWAFNINQLTCLVTSLVSQRRRVFSTLFNDFSVLRPFRNGFGRASLVLPLAFKGACAELCAPFIIICSYILAIMNMETVSYSIYLIIISIYFLSNTLQRGTGIYASLGIGRSFGKALPQRANMVYNISLVYGVVTSMVCCAVLICVFQVLWPRLYSDDDPAVDVFAKWIIILMAVWMVLESIDNVLYGILRGMGRQGFYLTSQVIGYLVIGFLMTMVFGAIGNFGVAGLWCGYLIGKGISLMLVWFYLSLVNWAYEIDRSMYRISSLYVSNCL